MVGENCKTDEHFFSPELVDQAQNISMAHNKSSRKWAANFAQQEFDSELDIYCYLKQIFFNTLEKIYEYVKENKSEEDSEESFSKSFHELFRDVKKLHLIEECYLHHFELSFVLWFYGKEVEEDVSYLQTTIDQKFIPDIPSSQDKRKTSALIKSLAAHLQMHLEHLGATTRQAKMLSSSIFKISLSSLDQIIQDVRDSFQNGLVESVYPVNKLISIFIIMELNDRYYTIKRMKDENNDQSTNKTKRDNFNKTLNLLMMFIVNHSKGIEEELLEEERGIVEKYRNSLIEEEEFHDLDTIYSLQEDELELSLVKSKALSIVWILKYILVVPINGEIFQEIL